jgi:hypothetical protein
MDETFHCPDLAIFFFLARNNRRPRAFEHCVDPRHRIVPAKSERRQQFFRAARRWDDENEKDKCD